ncbi:MAG: SDR family NAD(P)-dependent oxidoreductase [Planctomycetota bacterium]|nr:SDR family NAD(P)-dependent oxidoreductase [Planctomycetota bacterium]
MRGLRGKRVLVTGAAGGIGAATVKRFCEEGCSVWALDRDAAGLESLAAALVEAGLGAQLAGSSVTDVADPVAVAAAFAELHATWPSLDVLINNAGISSRRRFLELELDEWRRMLDVNLTGLFLVGQTAARAMAAAGSGVIVNMGSMNALIGCPNYAHYNASKAGVVELTKTMALELAPAVRVLSVCPGAVRTPMQEAEYTAAMFAALDAKIPLQRHGSPDEIAALFAFLASEEAPYVCGTSIVIDGGESSGGLASAANEEL